MEKFSVNKAKALKVLVVLAISASLSMGAYMLSAKEVTLSIDSEQKEFVTFSNTVEEFLQEEGITLDEYAYINIPLDAKLEDNINIIIKTAKPYTLASGDVKNEIVSVYTKVEDILKDQDIVLAGKDYTYPDLDEEVAPGTEIQIFKVEEIVEEVEEVIPHESLVKKIDTLNIGEERVAQKGQDGLKSIKINKVFENGKLVEEDIVEESIVKEATPEIIERGTKNLIASSRGTLRYRKVVTMTATAYDLSYKSTGKKPGDRGYGITASGTKARPGVVAVDPNVIPLGTKLYVKSLDGTNDYGYCVAEDTGGAIKGNKIDLFFNSSSEVKKFGRRKVEVYILE